MKLLIDIGNTRTKWRGFQANIRVDEGLFDNSELAEDVLNDFFMARGVRSIVLSNVGKTEIARMFYLVGERVGVQCQCIQSAREMAGLRFVYEEVTSLGVDRCLAMIGAYDNKGVLVIDAGSAITADYLAGDGRHLGGYILPGCRMLMLSLKAGTSKVLVDAEIASSEPGKSTQMCVNNGFTLMLQSLLTGLQTKAGELGISEVVITGGDADLIAHACPDIEFDQKNNLVLDGMEKLLNSEEL